MSLITKNLLKPHEQKIRQGEIFYEGIVFCNCPDNHHFGVHVSPDKKGKKTDLTAVHTLENVDP
jgi:hypothetical protein